MPKIINDLLDKRAEELKALEKGSQDIVSEIEEEVQPLNIPIEEASFPTLIEEWVRFYKFLSPDMPDDPATLCCFSFLATIWSHYIYIPKFPYKMSADLWLLFISPPAGLKSTAIDYLKDVLNKEDYNTPLPEEEKSARQLQGSYEGMCDWLAEHDNRSVLLYQDEFAPLILASQGYKGELKSELARFYGAHQSYSRTLRQRKGQKGRIEIQDITVNLIAGIQPAVFSQIPQIDLSQGLLTRFLPIRFGGGLNSYRHRRIRAEEREKINYWISIRDRMRERIEEAMKETGDLLLVDFLPEAEEIYDTYLDIADEWKLHQPEETQNWIHRQILSLGKLASLCAIAEQWEEGWEFWIKPSHLYAVAPLWKKALEFIPQLALQLGKSFASIMARKIADWIAQQGAREIRVRTIARNFNLSKKQVDAIIETGEIQGLWEREKVQGRGQPSEIIRLLGNP
jgi:transposase